MSSKDSADEAESARPIKRKRVTTSCLACNRRKVRCDRTWPCSNCRARNETESCAYMDGHVPAQAIPFRSASGNEVEALKAQMKQLESHIGRLVEAASHSLAPASSLPSSTPRSYPSATSFSAPALSTPPSTTGPSETSALDRTFLALDDLSRGVNKSASNTPAIALTPSTQHGVDAWPAIFLGTDSPIPSQRSSQLIYDIVAAIPKDEMLTMLVDHHFDDEGAYWHYVQRNVLQLEIEQFNSVRDCPGVLLVDPAWLALLVAISRISLRSLVSDELFATERVTPDGSTLASMDSQLDEAFDLALYCAGAFRKPQIRILQAFLIMISQQQIGRSMGAWDQRATFWHDMAISICKLLRLHVITDAMPDQDLPIDPAFPPSCPLYTREWSSRFVHNIVFMDKLIEAIEADRGGGEHPPGTHGFANLVTIPTPRNFRDEDLWNGLETTGRREPHPSFVLTEIIWQIHGFKITRLWRIITGLIRDPSSFTPEVVQSLDAEVRQGDYELLSLRSSYQLKQIEDILLESFHGSYQQRILRLHRSFFLRSYTDNQFAYSQAAALTAARAIIKGHKDVVDRHNTYRPRFLSLVFFSHHISAAILLFIHGCFKPSDRQRIQEELGSSHELFARARSPVLIENLQYWTLSVARGKLFIRAMSEALLHNPPSDLPAIEKFLLDLNSRGVDPADLDFASETSVNVTDFSLPSFFGLLDDPNQTYVQDSNAMLQNGVLDWDSIFAGF
ncbi:hypothetical protein CI109_105405 [Kwoniella shandongensis]|uniref:Zn(2)-C6 fungal-type domain-containing protein n=1 Tax=Kwoniella shandongensis TaxID=1734106 RepID=A0A5M6BNE3_9TREE|nr:uncharacterized protein CI109_007289 [Kwoniella shandongensis]KAA5524378.1 hypothetical protein CI109_007289 [Kwoniella shandongensis]